MTSPPTFALSTLSRVSILAFVCAAPGAIGCSEAPGTIDPTSSTGEPGTTTDTGTTDTSTTESGTTDTDTSETGMTDTDDPPEVVPDVQDLYLTMRDGERVAITVSLPPDREIGESFPTLLRGTRYWRGYELLMPLPGFDEEETGFAHAHDYALVRVDSRGSGASFGSRVHPWSVDEQLDYGEIIDWVVEQSWSNARVVSYGVSYDGNVADFVGLLDHPAVAAVSPQFSDVNPYTDLVGPGGVRNELFVSLWSQANTALDQNDLCAAQGASEAECEQIQAVIGGVKPTDGDASHALLDAALADHIDNLDVAAAFASVDHIDDVIGGTSLDALGPEARFAELEQAGTPIFALASWLDAGTATGALRRYINSDTPQTLYIGAWDHGGEFSADPFRELDTPLEVDRAAQMEAMIAYFDAALAGSAPARTIHYYTLNEAVWRTSETWPPAGGEDRVLYLGAAGQLRDIPELDPNTDLYAVDFSHTTGERNRWMQSENVYDDRADAPVLAYESEVLAEPVRVTGSVLATVVLDSTHSDGTLFVYLEDVAPGGEVTYITEGILRLSNRAVRDDPPFIPVAAPNHSLSSADAEAMVPNAPTELHIALNPTSVLFEAGHRIRVSFAGHDASVFQRIPAQGEPLLHLHRGGEANSRVVLPVLDGP